MKELISDSPCSDNHWQLFGEQSHQHLWVQCLERLAYQVNLYHGQSQWIRLRLYPALLLLYGGGIAALANRK